MERRTLTFPEFLETQGIEPDVRLDAAEPALPKNDGTRYTVGGVTAEGGMGSVLEAHDQSIRRTVAMKVVKPGLRSSREHLLRFVEEAQVTGQLEHPGIVPVHELGVNPDGDVFYTMKMVHGETLADILVRLRDGDPDTVATYNLNHLLNIFLRLCDAVAFAHSKGVIHRDLKPSNVMVGEYGEVLLMDWGLAKVLRTVDGRRLRVDEGGSGDHAEVSAIASERADQGMFTMAGRVMGTPAYMAPEQAEGRIGDLDERTDIYALGAILYSILALRAPVEGHRTDDVLTKVREGAIVSPSTQTGEGLPHCPLGRVPDALSAVAMKALALCSEDRYIAAGELRQQIENWQAGYATDAEDASFWRHLRLFVARHKTEVRLIAAAAVLLAVVVATFVVKVNKEKNAALIARNDAVGAQAAAETAEAATKKAYTELEEKNYANLIAAVAGKIRAGAPGPAVELLWQTPQRLRHWEWGYLLRQCHQGLLTLLPGGGGARCVAFSRDGALLAIACGGSGPVRLWDVAQGVFLDGLSSIRGETVAFSRDGKWLVVGDCHGWVRIVDVAENRENVHFRSLPRKPGTMNVTDVEFLANGERVAVAYGDGTVRIWHLDTVREETVLDCGQKGVTSIALSPDGSRLVAGSGDKQTVLWNLATRERVWTVTTGGTSPNFVAFSPDGRLVASNVDWTKAVLLDPDTGERLRTFSPRNQGGAMCTAFSPDSRRLIAGFHVGTVRCWYTWNGTEGEVLDAHDGALLSLDFSPDGRLVASAGWDGSAKLWPAEALQRFAGAMALVATNAMALSPDGDRIAAGGRSGTPGGIWDVPTGEKVTELPGHSDHVESIAFSPGGREIVTASLDGTARVWDASTGTARLVLRGHEGPVRRAAWSPDSRHIVTAGGDKTARIWDVRSGDQLSLYTHLHVSDQALFAPQGYLALPGRSRGEVRVLDTRDGDVVMQCQGQTDSVESMAFSHDGALLAVGYGNGTAIVYDVARSRELATMEGHWGRTVDLAFSPDSRRLLVANRDRTVSVWDATSWRELLAIDVPDDLTGVRFLPGCRRVMVASDYFARLLDAYDWTLTREQTEQQRLEDYRRWVTQKGTLP